MFSWNHSFWMTIYVIWPTKISKWFGLKIRYPYIQWLIIIFPNISIAILRDTPLSDQPKEFKRHFLAETGAQRHAAATAATATVAENRENRRKKRHNMRRLARMMLHRHTPGLVLNGFYHWINYHWIQREQRDVSIHELSSYSEQSWGKSPVRSFDPSVARSQLQEMLMSQSHRLRSIKVN